MIKRHYFYNVRITHPQGGYAYAWGIFYHKSWFPPKREHLMEIIDEVVEKEIRPKYIAFENKEHELISFNRI